MKIDVAGTGSRAPLSPFDLEHGRKVSSGLSEFSSELEEHSSNAGMDELKQLFDKIDQQGKVLSKSPTYDELMEYRKLIKDFVNAAVPQMYSVNSSIGWDRMGRHKAYTTIKKINRELEDMADKIRLGQSDQLDVVASHDAIRGMLLDLYM